MLKSPVRIVSSLAAMIAVALIVGLSISPGHTPHRGAAAAPKVLKLVGYTTDTSAQQADANDAGKTEAVQSVPSTDGSGEPQDPSTVTVNSDGYPSNVTSVTTAATTRDQAESDFFPNDTVDSSDTQTVVVVQLIGNFQISGDGPHPPGTNPITTGNVMTETLDANGDTLDFSIQQQDTAPSDPTYSGNLHYVFKQGSTLHCCLKSTGPTGPPNQ